MKNFIILMSIILVFIVNNKRYGNVEVEHIRGFTSMASCQKAGVALVKEAEGMVRSQHATFKCITQ